MISFKDPINLQDELSSPLSGTLISACDEGDEVSCFYPEPRPRGPCRSGPEREEAVIAFSVEIMGQDTAKVGVSVQERKPV